MTNKSICIYVFFALSLLTNHSQAAGNFTWTSNCVNPGAIKANSSLSSALNAVSASAGESLVLFSCYRSPKYNEMKRRQSMARNRGKSGVAKNSAHMRPGVAADFCLKYSDRKSGAPGPGCHIINKARIETMGHRGGIGSYGRCPGRAGSWFHLDSSRQRDWGACNGVTSSNSNAVKIGKPGKSGSYTDKNVTQSPIIKSYASKRTARKKAQNNNRSFLCTILPRNKSCSQQ